MLTINPRYLFYSSILLIVEVLIALYVRDSFIRPYGGDYLVVILLYCCIKTLSNTSRWKIACGVLLFSFSLEVAQYFHLVDRLGLSGSTLAKTVIGYGFEWWDLVAYTLGVATAVVLDRPKG